MFEDGAPLFADSLCSTLVRVCWLGGALERHLADIWFLFRFVSVGGWVGLTQGDAQCFDTLGKLGWVCCSGKASSRVRCRLR
jgi:hypothetical protein